MHPEIDRIRGKVLNSPWPKFVRAVSIAGLRGWTGQEIRFEFPVTVLAGENGSGKTTVLKAVAAAYTHPTDRSLALYPSVFFPDTAWESTSNIALLYKIREGTAERDYRIFKRTRRWRFQEGRPRRNVLLLDVSRTLPLDATAGYARIAKRNATESGAQLLAPEITTYYSSILGRRYDEARIAHSNLDSRRPVGVVRTGGLQYSQFHQGAGEDATLDLLSTIQSMPDTSLIIIDEVEASLHPRAQRRLVHFLLWLARTKSIQVIVSTHSGYVLDELPPEARIFLARGTGGIDVLYGSSANYALNRMDDIDHPDLYLFTEDTAASEALRALLRLRDVDLSRVRCMEVGPYSMVEALGELAAGGRLPVPALGILDPDRTEVRRGCLRLPGTMATERQVFEDIQQRGVAQLAVRLELSQDSVNTALSSASTLPDHHGWVEAVARATGQTEEYLWATMCQVWARHCLDASVVDALVGAVRGRLPE
jgi:predicted ATPase